MLCIRIALLVVLCRMVNSAGLIEIGMLPATVEVFEDAAGNTFLHSFSFYKSASVVGTVTCSFDVPQSDYEMVADSGGSSQYTVQLVASPALDFDDTPVSLSITCSAGATSSTSQTLTVNLIENVAPAFTNNPGSVDLSAKTTKAGRNIFTISYTDTDTDSPLPYQTITSITPAEPTAGVTLFSVANDILKVDYDLLDYDDLAQYIVETEIGDERTTSTVTVTVNIYERNTPPEFVNSTNVDVSFDLPEFTAGRLLVYDVDAFDPEGDTVQMTLNQIHVGASDYELVPSTGEFYLLGGVTLDYETTIQYVYQVEIEDYIDQQTTSTFTLTINVININEQPTYAATPSAVAIDEAANGTIVGTLDQLCTDPDGVPPDDISYTILFSTESSYFSIDSSTAEVSLAKDYDYDDVNLANEVNLTIRCSDTDGLTDDTIYSITIQDINDNPPTCSPSTTSFSLTYAQAVSSTIVNVDCSDIDSTINAELEYTIIGFTSGYSRTYFQVDTDGNVSISSPFQMDYNTSFYVTVLINDNGTNPGSLSATVTLTITYTEAPTINDYTKISECFLCTTSAITLISASGLVVFVMLIVFIVLVVLMCCYRCESTAIAELLTKKKKKRSWRWCGCLRPGELKKRKKTKRERMLAEKRDEEYFRARNALAGIDGETPSGDPSLSSKNSRRHEKKSLARVSGSSVTYPGRDKTPDISATPVNKKGLTTSQRQQLEKFNEMKKTTADADGPSTSKKSQAGGGVIWTFDGR